MDQHIVAFSRMHVPCLFAGYHSSDPSEDPLNNISILWNGMHWSALLFQVVDTRPIAAVLVPAATWKSIPFATWNCHVEIYAVPANFTTMSNYYIRLPVVRLVVGCRSKSNYICISILRRYLYPPPPPTTFDHDPWPWPQMAALTLNSTTYNLQPLHTVIRHTVFLFDNNNPRFSSTFNLSTGLSKVA